MPTKILVIEDTAEIRNNLQDFLEAEDFDVMVAQNGRAGIQLARQHQFDLILCDVMMPELDGYGVITQLREDPKTADVPFIFLTAKGERSDLRLGMNLGADDYITKPFTPAELLEAVQARLERAAHQQEKLRQVSEQLEQLENFDGLTGLPNQSALQGEAGIFDRAIAQVDGQNRFVPFLLLGLDRFSRINDALGYSQGDQLLQKVAQRLKDFTQRVNGAGVARVSGDEFAIVLPPTADKESAVAIADDLLKAIAQPFTLDSKPIPLTGSIGIAFYPLANSLEELHRQTSIALSSAKREGGNRSSIYNRPMFGFKASKDLQLAAAFYQAWEQKSFQVYYQPRIDLRTKKLVAAGAVVYWQHPFLDALSSEKILSLAGEAGLILPLNEWLLSMALQQAKSWLSYGIQLRVSVALSDLFFTDREVDAKVMKVCQEVGIDGRYLELEVAAETIAKITNANATASQLMAWQKRGIHTTISKFSGSHTSLDYLHQLALNSLKIDRQVTANSAQNAPLISAIVQIAHQLKLKAVAEGVETEVQSTFLKKQKCDEVQMQEAISPQNIQQFFVRRW